MGLILKLHPRSLISARILPSQFLQDPRPVSPLSDSPSTKPPPFGCKAVRVPRQDARGSPTAVACVSPMTSATSLP